MSITHNGTTRTSMHDLTGSARIIFLGGADSLLRVYLNFDTVIGEQAVMLNAVIPGGNEPGIYHADSSANPYERNVQLMVGQKSYFSNDLQLIISTLGNYREDGQ